MAWHFSSLVVSWMARSFRAALIWTFAAGRIHGAWSIGEPLV